MIQFNQPCKRPSHPPDRASQSGQSLMEFVLVMPLLVLILIGGFSFGMGTYEAHLASDAIQLPALNKMNMAKSPGAVAGGTLLGYVTAGGTSGTLTSGALLDTINKVKIDDYTSVIVGTKSFTPLASFLPGFTIKTAQVMNTSLMDPANNGFAKARPAGTAWVPGGTPVKPPWL